MLLLLLRNIRFTCIFSLFTSYLIKTRIYCFGQQWFLRFGRWTHQNCRNHEVCVWWKCWNGYSKTLRMLEHSTNDFHIPARNICSLVWLLGLDATSSATTAFQTVLPNQMQLACTNMKMACIIVFTSVHLLFSFFYLCNQFNLGTHKHPSVHFLVLLNFLELMFFFRIL